MKLRIIMQENIRISEKHRLTFNNILTTGFNEK